MQVVPPRVRDIVEACWDKDPESRPEFDEVVDALEQVAAELQPTFSGAGGAGGGAQCCVVQ